MTPLAPPIEPMLAKLAEAFPTAALSLRAEVGRLSRHRLSRRRRASTSRAATSGRSIATFPSCTTRCSRGCRRDCVVDGEIVIATPRRARLRRAAAAPASGRLRAWPSWRAETPASFVAFDLLALGGADSARRPQRERRARLERAARRRHAAAASHADDTRRSRPRAEWLAALRGRGSRRRDREARRRRLPAGQARDDQGQARRAPPTASSAGFRWHKTRPATPSARCCSGCTTSSGKLHHVGVTSSFTMAMRKKLATELEPLRDERARRSSVARAGPAPEGEGVTHARRPEPMERGQGSVVGAAAHRARVRGEVRPPAGRPLPARGDVPALAARQGRRGLPLRPARGDDALRAWRGCSTRADRRRPRDATAATRGASPGCFL